MLLQSLSFTLNHLSNTLVILRDVFWVIIVLEYHPAWEVVEGRDHAVLQYVNGHGQMYVS